MGQHVPVVKPAALQRGCALQCDSTVGLDEGAIVGFTVGEIAIVGCDVGMVGDADGLSLGDVVG